MIQLADAPTRRAAGADGMRWVLLLRAVNLGPRNKLKMADMRGVLEGLGYDDV